MTCNCRPRGELEVGLSSKAFETSAPKEGRRCLAPGHGRLSPRKNTVTILQEAGQASTPFCTVWKFSPDRDSILGASSP